MLFSTALIVVGLLLLVGGGEALVRGAVGLATLLRLTPAVIGLTIVAMGTSVPELAVSAFAAWRGSTEIAVGNVVGSNMFNILVILGLASVVRPLVITGNTIRLEYPVLALVTLLAVVVCGDGIVSRLDAALFLAVYTGFTVYVVGLVRVQLTRAEAMEFAREAIETATQPPRVWISTVLVAGGVALLGGGAHATVTGAVELATLLGMSERVIGLTIVSVGTGLPELVTSMVACYRGRDDVAVSNVIGSNLFNTLVILGLSGLVMPLPVPPETTSSDNWWMLGTTLLLFPFMFTGRRVSRWEGACLLTVYAVYLGLLLTR